LIPILPGTVKIQTAKIGETGLILLEMLPPGQKMVISGFLAGLMMLSMFQVTVLEPRKLSLLPL